VVMIEESRFSNEEEEDFCRRARKTLIRSMHYERAALLRGVYRGDAGRESEEKIGKPGSRMAFYLEGKTRLRAMFFPPRRQLK